MYWQHRMHLKVGLKRLSCNASWHSREGVHSNAILEINDLNSMFENEVGGSCLSLTNQAEISLL